MKKITKYWPLFCLILIAALAAFALSHAVAGTKSWMHFFMGFFLCQFAMLKLFNLRGFVEGFQKYDLLASKLRLYGWVYPFLELLLGLGFLSFIWPVATYIATLILLLFGAIGVFIALARGLDTKCACMGTVLDVPLSTVAVVEDIGMAAMAAILLVSRF